MYIGCRKIPLTSLQIDSTKYFSSELKNCCIEIFFWRESIYDCHNNAPLTSCIITSWTFNKAPLTSGFNVSCIFKAPLRSCNTSLITSAVFNKESEKYRLIFSVFYLDEEKIRVEKPTDVYNTMSTNYYLNENANSATLIENQKYESVRSIEIITEELNKREKKKFGFIN